LNTVKKLVSPAIRLMNRFNYPGRLMLTGALGFLAIVTLLATIIHHQRADIKASKNELATIELMRPLHVLVQLTQQHRGISSALLSGDTSLRSKLESRQTEIAAAISAVDIVEQKYADLLKAHSEWQTIKIAWTRLQHDVLRLRPEETLQRHGVLIEHILRFQVTLADTGGLTLDNEMHTFYLASIMSGSLPELLERLGKMRAKGTGILVRKKISPEERIAFTVHNELLKRTLGVLEHDLDKAARHVPALARELKAFSIGLGAAVDQATALVEHDILTGKFAVTPAEFFDRITVATDIGYREMFDTVIPTLNQQIEARINRLQFNMMVQIGLTLLFLLLLLYLAIGSYFTIIESVRRLSAGAAGIEAGDLKTRIRLDGQDELTDVAHSFNTMAISLEKLMRDSRQINAELQAALDAAHLADQTKDAFLANVSHELRTPLNAVIGLADLARRPDANPAKRLDYLVKIADAGRTLSSLINDLLDLSKIAAGRMELHLVTFRPADLVVRVQSIMSFRLAEKGLPLRVEIAPDVPVALIGDSLRLEQVLLNLLGNAIKFTHTGHVELRLGVVSRHEATVRLKIEVEDTGIGMSEEETSRVFLPFAQADASMSRKYGGTGLGLSLCKRIAEIMAGQISVRSELQRGSVFSVEVDLALGDPADVYAETAVVDRSAETLRYENVRVLAVDDQPMNREIVYEMLTSVGIVVRLAENGQQALDEIFKAGPGAFDLVLMDIQMPVLDGLEATRRLFLIEIFRALPVIAMTAHTMEHEKALSAAAGMVDHIGKPFDSLHFYNVLRRWIPVEKQRMPDLTASEVPAIQAFSLMDALNAIEGFDAAGGLSRFGGKEDRYLKWLAEFVDTGPDLPRVVNEALASGHHEAAVKAVHAFKGRVGTLGIGKLHAQVIALEKTLRAGDPADAMIQATAEVIGSTRTALKSVFSQHDAALTGGRPHLKQFVWTEAYSVGVPGLDEQHKRIIALINRLADLHGSHAAFPVQAVHEVLSEMHDYSQTHFKSEEAYLRQIGFPEIEPHLREHSAFIEDISAFSIATSRGVLDLAELHGYLTRWLIEHILESDMHYRDYQSS
jgi:hemerythrin-like metal-binding protein